jgi:hypothetical protein
VPVKSSASQFRDHSYSVIRHTHSHRRIDHAWADSIDHNAPVRIFKGGALCQTNDGVVFSVRLVFPHLRDIDPLVT